MTSTEVCADCKRERVVTKKKVEVWCRDVSAGNGDGLCQTCWDARWEKRYEASNVETVELHRWLREADIENAVSTLKRLAPERLAGYGVLTDANPAE
jgi:hypothetical protein